jgi:hypothetical protein
MAFDPSFLLLMETTAQYLTFLDDDAYGQSTYGPGIAFLCHVTYDRKIIRSNTEDDRESTAQLQMPPPGYVVGGVPTPQVTIYDQIILPYDSIQRKVLDVKTYTDETGVHHQSIALV